MTNKSKLVVLALALSAGGLAPMAQALTLDSLRDSTTSNRVWGAVLTIDGKSVFRSVMLETKSGNKGSGFSTLNTGGLPGKAAIRQRFYCSDGSFTNETVGVTTDWSVSSGTIQATCPTNTTLSYVRGEYKVKCPTKATTWSGC